jgi:transposase
MAEGRTKGSRRDEPTRDTPDRQEQDIERLREENDRLRKLLEEYAKRIADLERQLALKQQNSTITSKPPSSDGLAGQQRERGRREKSRRKAGGQPGHPGRHRELAPVERVDAIVDLAPEACRHCARRLHARQTVGGPRRHQVTELPPIAAHITEYRCHRRRCPDCGTVTLALLPDEHATQFGPQLTALIAYLTVVCRMPRLVVQRFLEGALQIPISLGSTQNAWEETSAAVAAPYAELEAPPPADRGSRGDLQSPRCRLPHAELSGRAESRRRVAHLSRRPANHWRL